MFFLLLNIVFASSFTLIAKWVQTRQHLPQRENIVTIGAINYIIAAICITPEYLSSGLTTHHPNAMLAGGIMGACYFTAFFFFIRAIRWVGAAASTAVSVLSIIVPIAFGIFIWGEKPNGQQFLGIIAALIALALIGGRSKRTSSKSTSNIDETAATDREEEQVPIASSESTGSVPGRAWVTPFVLIGFFVLAGSNRLAQEAFKHTSPQDQRPVFLMTAFAVASIPSLGILFYRRKISKTELTFGIGMGMANILQSHFVLKALQYYDGFIVFPLCSAGGLMLTTIVATRILHEKLSLRSWYGIATTVLALILLNWES